MSNAEENSAPVKKSRTSLLLVVVAVLALIGVALSVYTLFFSDDAVANDEPQLVEVAGPYRQFGPMDFTVNLAESGQRSYLKATVTLAFEERSLENELEERRAQIRDMIIEILRSKEVAEVSHGVGTEQLRSEMIAELNPILSEGEIIEIYFTDFLVQ